MTVATQRPVALAAQTLSEALRLTARRRGDALALHDEQGLEGGLSWREYDRLADRVAATLWANGLRRGDTVAFMLRNRWEFHVLDAGAMRLGATTVSLYNAATEDQHRHVLGDSGARWLLAERSLLPDLEMLPAAIELITVVDDAAASDVSFEELLAGGPEGPPDASVGPDDLLCLVYTSGTTGEAKGVEIEHRAALLGARAFLDAIPLEPDGRVVSYLPMAHVAERACSHYMPMLLGTAVHCCRDPKEVFAVLPSVRPSLFFSVPRLWEKLRQTILARIADQPLEVRERFERADEDLAAGVRSMLGLDEASSLVVGGAMTPPSVLAFFQRLGMPLLETWGMAELCAVAAANRPGHARLGSVGPPVDGVELRIAPDGEVLARTDARLRAYRNNPAETRRLMDRDGWVHTGDLGSLDADGFLTITGRKKALIVSAQGKNVSPLLVESTLADELPIAAQICCIGDDRPYLVAVLTVEVAEAAELSGRVRAGIEHANRRLGRAERVHRVLIVRGEWTPESGLLTPTHKLRRGAIEERYRDDVDALYAEPGGDTEEVLVRSWR